MASYVFVIFWQFTFLQLHRIYLLFDWSKLLFLDVLIKDKFYLICV